MKGKVTGYYTCGNHTASYPIGNFTTKNGAKRLVMSDVRSLKHLAAENLREFKVTTSGVTVSWYSPVFRQTVTARVVAVPTDSITPNPINPLQWRL